MATTPHDTIYGKTKVHYYLTLTNFNIIKEITWALQDRQVH